MRERENFMARLIDADALHAELVLRQAKLDAETRRLNFPRIKLYTEMHKIIDKMPTICCAEQEEEMTFSEYQKLAARTINSQLKPPAIADHAVCGMVSEIGEFCGIFQKGYQGHAVRPEHLKKELGDLLWFVAEFCTVMNWNLEDIPSMNISKLIARYPEGFEAEKSLHRAAGDI